MNPPEPSSEPASTVPPEANPPLAVRQRSPVWQTLLIVGILLAGLLAARAILQSEKKASAGESTEEKSGGEAAGGKTSHAHGGEHEHEHEHGAKGHVELTPEKLKNAHLELEAVGPATIRLNLRVFGKIVPNEEKLAHVSPRFAGVVQRVNKRLGEPVASGEVLAVVESNESLRTYDVRAPLAGTVLERNVSVGEFVGTDKSLFTVADLGTVWADFQIYQQDFARLHLGQAVRIAASSRAVGDTPPAVADGEPDPAENSTADLTSPTNGVRSTLAYLSPFGAESTQTMLARAEVPNPDGKLKPGLFVTGQIAVDEVKAAVAVREGAVQTLDGQEVVFVAEGDAFEARPVRLGRRDSDWAEVLSGVEPGDRYVTANSFILKAEIGKENAEHED